MVIALKYLKNIDMEQYDLVLHDGSHIGEEVLVDLNNIYPYLKARWYSNYTRY